jgi:hypothetical protein
MINLFKIVYSLTGIAYVWSLPFLAKVGFAEKNATSISGFIANAPATGAMAALSFAPITLMWSYQNYKFNKLFLLKRQINILEISLSLYQFFYSMFLICSENYAPKSLHITSVICFGLSFIIHGWLTVKYLKSNKLSIIILSTGTTSFVILLFVKNMWFWAVECISYSCMLLFTPVMMLDQKNVPFDYISL